MDLPVDLLARKHGDPAITIREDLEDALKEYSELDLLVEILQNALDAIDHRRYVAICAAAGRNPADVATIEHWNKAVVDMIEQDYAEYSASDAASDRANIYKKWSDQQRRRDAWWAKLASLLGGTPATLAEAADSSRGKLAITIRTASPYWIEAEDNGPGMPDIPDCFRHKASTKRPRNSSSPRRLGIRGNHGWGLTAVLGMSDCVEVCSRIAGVEAKAFRFSEYPSFVSGSAATPKNQSIDLASTDASVFSSRIKGGGAETGTHVRVRLGSVDQGNLLGHALKNYSPQLFEYLLRIYTPVGQTNDYVFHAAFHTSRRDDVSVAIHSFVPGEPEDVRTIQFDTLRLAELNLNQVPFDTYVNTGWPPKVSVHTIHRTKRGNHIYLSGAEIQATEVLSPFEDMLAEQKLLPAFEGTEGPVAQVPRGFQLSLSGGIRSEYLARPPTGNTAMLRGTVLAETARPTLGRKYVMDQREAIPRAARDHQTAYEEVRKKVKPQTQPPVATPAHAKWRREFFDGLLADVSKAQNKPLSESLAIWATGESLEARTMLVFGELLGRNVFGDIRLLRAHLRDKYDFGFLQTVALASAKPIPCLGLANSLVQAAFAIIDRRANRFQRYGIGEFKALGHEVFDDFNPKDPRKSPDMIDLLVCWDFEATQVEDNEWSVDVATDLNAELRGQTHTWLPGGDKFQRTRPLAVIALRELLTQLVAAGTLQNPVTTWPTGLPKNYF